MVLLEIPDIVKKQESKERNFNLEDFTVARLSYLLQLICWLSVIDTGNYYTAHWPGLYCSTTFVPVTVNMLAISNKYWQSLHSALARTLTSQISHKRKSRTCRFLVKKPFRVIHASGVARNSKYCQGTVKLRTKLQYQLQLDVYGRYPW